MIPSAGKYDKFLKSGCYKSALCGIYALSLAIYLQPKEIYLLGYDYGAFKKNITHFYQNNFKHKGTGNLRYYNGVKNRANLDFLPFKNSDVKIYNVGLNSKIDIFEKLSYEEFFNKLDNINYNQENLRKTIINKIREVSNE